MRADSKAGAQNLGGEKAPVFYAPISGGIIVKCDTEVLYVPKAIL